MNAISEALLQAVDIVMDEKVSTLQYDKTIQATIYSLVNLDTGEYKVRYNGNIFSVYAENLNESFKDGDTVYVIVPEGNFSNRKIISHKITSHSLSAAQISSLQNSIIEISPTFDALGYTYDSAGTQVGSGYEPWGLVAGRHGVISIFENSGSYQATAANSRFQQYANQYEYIRIQASFLTSLFEDHTKGDYGLEVCFYAKDEDGSNLTEAIYRLNLNSFTGDPYRLSVYSPQSVIIQAQKNYLLGLKYIHFYEEDFEYDHYIENGEITTKAVTNDPNLFVKDVFIQYVDRQDLNDTLYYLTISAKQGISFTNSLSSLLLTGALIYDQRDIMDSSTCVCKWFIRDLTVMVGDSAYDKEAGFGWRQITTNDFNKLTVSRSSVGISQRYKLVVVYNSTTTLTTEITLFNTTSDYAVALEQVTEGDNIYLQLNAIKGDWSPVANWYFSNPDGSYSSVTDGNRKDRIAIKDYLIYSSVTFYCEVFDSNTSNFVQTTLEHVVNNSQSEEDVIITYDGEDSFRYDANGDITIEDSEKERTLAVSLAWKSGIGSAYKLEWLDKDGNNLARPAGTQDTYSLDSSMIEKLWVDSNNVLHYTIKQKYKVTFNNNTIYIRITTVDEKVYTFSKEILFVKDGDQGTNGTTYVIALRPTTISNDATLFPSHKLSGFQALQYNGSRWLTPTWWLGCYIYKDGEFINNSSDYDIDYQWKSVGFSLTSLTGAEVEPRRYYSGLDRVVMVSPSPAPSTNSAVYYVKVETRIREKSSDKTFYVYSLYPIDVINGRLSWTSEDFDTSDLPSYVQYTASGLNPSFYSNDLNVYFKDGQYTNITPRNASLIDVIERDGKKYLSPASNFIFENVKSQDGNIGALQVALPQSSYLLHSIVMYLNTFGNEAINGWDGTTVDVNEEDGYVFAPQVGAGTKDSYNRFSGVVMGKDSGQDEIGLYGYRNGINTFGLMESGKAYFGAKSGGGQIVLDGRSAMLYGGDIEVNDQGKITRYASNGMYIRLADDASGENRFDTDKVTSDTKAIGIGYAPKDESATTTYEENFWVKYDGKMHATQADVQGAIYAKEGYLGGSQRITEGRPGGGWVIKTNKLYSDNVTLYSGSEEAYAPVSTSTVKDYYRFWAGSAHDAPRKAKFSITNSGVVKMAEAIIYGDIYAKGGRIGCSVSFNSETGEVTTEGGWLITRDTISCYQNNASSGVDKYVALSTSGTYAIQAGNVASRDSSTDSRLLNETAFSVTHAGTLKASKADISGKITANEGTIGNWKINNGNNYRLESSVTNAGTRIFLDGSATANDKALYIGYTAPASASEDTQKYDTSANGYCYITANGKLYAQGAEIRGTIKSNDGKIGGWTLDRTRLYNGNVGLSSTGQQLLSVKGSSVGTAYLVFWANATAGNSSGTLQLNGDTYFGVTGGGKLYCASADVQGRISSESGNIGGWEINTYGLANSDRSIYLYNDSSQGYAIYVKGGFSVDTSGKMRATDAYLSGEIQSSQGRIGGWYITANTLQNQSGTVYLDSAKGLIYGAKVQGAEVSSEGTNNGVYSKVWLATGSLLFYRNDETTPSYGTAAGSITWGKGSTSSTHETDLLQITSSDGIKLIASGASGGGLGIQATNGVWISSRVYAQQELTVYTTLRAGSTEDNQNQWVINGTSMHYYNAGGTSTFGVTSAGAITGASINVSGSITGGTISGTSITISGTTSLAGFSSSAGGSVTGTMTATYFSGNGSSLTNVPAVFG